MNKLIGPKALAQAVVAYLKSHPEEIPRAIRCAAGLRIGIPLDALRYVVRELLRGDKAPQDVVIEAVPPGLAVAASVRAMGTSLRANLTVYVESLDFGEDRYLIELRIGDMNLAVLDDCDTPLAALVRSGALDLSKPGNLLAYMPKRPAMLLDAKDDRVTVDALLVPAIANNQRLRRLLHTLLPVICATAIQTVDDHLEVSLSVRPDGLREAMASLNCGM